MRIHNIRLGHACNSSSSHSIVLLPQGRTLKECGADTHFGWDAFTLVSKERKREYLAAQLLENLATDHGRSVAVAVVKSWLGVDFHEDANEPAVVAGSEGVDHQSVIRLPRDRRDPRAIDRAFFDAFAKEVLRDDVAVLGGNDNGGKHPDSDAGVRLFTQMETDSSRSFQNPMFARYDDHGFWSFYERSSGNKIRFSFSDGTANADKASAPELVDIKITDRCPFGCAYCYQGSTPQGNDANADDFYFISDALASLGTFEVALGGGEPTLHPDFEKIVQRFHQNNITVNVTTKNLKFFRDLDARENILPMLGAVAVSVDNGEQVRKLVDACKGLDKNLASKIRFQVVMGLHRREDFKWFLQDIAHAYDKIETLLNYDWRRPTRVVTLLGYKTTGFGGSFRKKNTYDWWLDEVKKLYESDDERQLRLSYSIDTALAAETGAEKLASAGISRIFYGTEEGKFSMYIDAVSKRMGPSSYCEPLLMKPLEPQALLSADVFRDRGEDMVKSIKGAFARW